MRVVSSLLFVLMLCLPIGVARPQSPDAACSTRARDGGVPVSPRLGEAAALLSAREAAALCVDLAEAARDAGRRELALELAGLAESRASALPAGQELEGVELMRRTGVLVGALGEPARAVALLEQADAVQTRILGQDHPSLRFVEADLANAYRQAGRSDRATVFDDRVARSSRRMAAEALNIRTMGPSSPNAPANANAELITVVYATTRARTGKTSAREYFGKDRASLSYGEVLVSVPRADDLGADIPRPSIWRLEFSPDPNRHIIVSDVMPVEGRAGFLASLRRLIDASDRKETFVFIHGFNQDFAQAVETTAHLARNLEIDGAPVLFSWASSGTIPGYLADETVADLQLNISALASMLRDVATQGRQQRVHVVAHSMGNRLLLKALQELRPEFAPSSGKTPFDEIVFGSPDVDADDFATRAPIVRPLARRLTLYASDADEALQISQKMHAFRRAGNADPALSMPEVFDTVDTTAVGKGLGHSDFAGAARDDLRGVVWFSQSPNHRCVLRAQPVGVWSFAAPESCPERAYRTALWMLRRNGNKAAAGAALARIIAHFEGVAAQGGSAGEEARRSLDGYRRARAVLDAFPGN